ncbi:RNA-directed DNA polymerase from mobile element jockey [Trichonephila clavipes]|nr:RNA-directed DNA polymerase from mobile element jockey [Trichonephila clavipes]
METQSDDQSVIMEEINPETLTGQQKCTNLQSIDKQIRIFTVRKEYVKEMLDIEKSIPCPTTETTQKLEADATSLDENIKALEGPTQPVSGVELQSSLKDLFPAPPLLTGVEARLVALTDQEPFLVYIAPNPTYRSVGADLDAIFKIFKTAILAGDYNAKHTSWGCVSSDSRGNYLLRCITNNNLDLSALPTRYGTDPASTLDYALIKNLNWPCTADSLSELSSDHNRIRFYFPRTSKIEIPPPQLNTTWSIFTKILANPEKFDLLNANSTHESVSNLTSEILNAHVSASKLSTTRSSLMFRAWEDNLSTPNAEDNSVWGIAKAFGKKSTSISAFNGPTGIAFSDTNKTEVIAHLLESQFQFNDIHNPHKDEIITSIVDVYLNSNINNTDILPPPLPFEIIQYIKKIKIRKCPGRDGITLETWEKPGSSIILQTNQFTSCP